MLTGFFSRNGANPTTVFQDAQAGEAVFGSWSGSASHAGSFTSAVFRAPGLLNFRLAGYPNKGGISLYLEDAQDHRKLALNVRADPRETWKRFEWTLPADWRDRSVRLIADDRSQTPGGWIGLTLPREGSAQGPLQRLLHAAAYSVLMGAEGTLFLLPGFVLALLLQRRFTLDEFRFTAVAFTGAAAIGYFFFWTYFASVGMGKIVSFLVLGMSVVASPLLLRQGWKRSAGVWLHVWRELALSFVLVMLISWFYLGIGYLYKVGDSPGLQAADRITVFQMPPDHLLPMEVANRIYRELPLRPSLLGMWKSSDRPPLQSGIFLAQLPFWKVYDAEVHYYLLAIFLQSLWAGAVWLFLRFAGVPRRTILLVLALCVFSGFFFLNSFYVWPKLLAAALLLIGLTFSTFTRPDYQWTTFDTVLAGAAIALALLSHTGVLLAVPGLAWVLYRHRALPGWRTAAWGAATIVLLWLPWVMYQKLYDPPGNLLMKAHLAGSIDQDHSFGQLLFDAYGKLGIEQWARNKLDNIRVLFVPDFFRQIFEKDALPRYSAFSGGNFFSMFQALGLLNFGLLVRLGMRGRAARAEFRLADRCMVAALVSTGIWCLIMFNPGSTIIHQGSLATMLLLFLALGIYLAALSPRLAWAVPAIQTLVIFPLFVFGKPLFGNPRGTLMEGVLDPGFVAVAVFSLAGLLVWAELTGPQRG